MLLNNIIKSIDDIFKDEKGDSEIIETAVALIFILAVFLAFIIYSSAAREKTVINYSAKEGARAYMIAKKESDGIDMAEQYLKIGGVKDVNVTTGDNSIRIEKDLPVKIPFFTKGNLKLVSEVEFHKELDPFWYQKDIYRDGWLHERWRKRNAPTVRSYNDDAVDDPYR